MSVPSPEQVARFRADFAARAGGAPGRLGVAVSGGSDSFALLLLACAAWPERVVAATVDHGLRPENAAEASFVADICRGSGVPHATLSHPDRAAPGGNVQASARALRYALLSAWAGREGCTHLATAHHADDQAETLLMRLARGSGLPGLAGIRPARRLTPGPMLVRPLLGWRRAELADIVAAAGLTAVDDPSNRSPDFDRTRFRALLAGTDQLPPLRLAAAADHLGDCEEALAWSADRTWRDRAAWDGNAVTIDPAELPREVRRRLARRAVEEVRAAAGLAGLWREEGLDRLLETLPAGARSTLAGVLCSGGAAWRFEIAPPRRR